MESHLQIDLAAIFRLAPVSVIEFAHPMGFQGLLVVLSRSAHAAKDTIPAVYAGGQQLAITCIWQDETPLLALPNSLYPHLSAIANWMKYRSRLLFGQEVRNDIPDSLLRPDLLTWHLEQLRLHARNHVILRLLMENRFDTLRVELAHLSCLTQMSALLSAGDWEVTYQSAKTRFGRQYADSPASLALKNLECGLAVSQQAAREQSSDDIYHVVWLFEEFIRQTSRLCLAT